MSLLTELWRIEGLTVEQKMEIDKIGGKFEAIIAGKPEIAQVKEEEYIVVTDFLIKKSLLEKISEGTYQNMLLCENREGVEIELSLKNREAAKIEDEVGFGCGCIFCRKCGSLKRACSPEHRRNIIIAGIDSKEV